MNLKDHLTETVNDLKEIGKHTLKEPILPLTAIVATAAMLYVMPSHINQDYRQNIEQGRYDIVNQKCIELEKYNLHHILEV
jgi:hypothetical protein